MAHIECLHFLRYLNHVSLKPRRFQELAYLGPVFIKMGKDQQKVWVCLFTYLVIRTIHLDYCETCRLKNPFLDFGDSHHREAVQVKSQVIMQ